MSKIVKTFDVHAKSKFWSSKNKGVPSDYALNSHKKCWFDCICGHTFEKLLKDINLIDSWCPYCIIPNKKLCGEIDCKTCFDKSFASNEKSKFWSPKNKISPIQIAKNSHKIFLFDCICGHEFESGLSYINFNNAWCNYCANKKLCESNCDLCFKKTFAINDKSKFWSSKNKLRADQVFKCSNVKAWFNCIKCNNEFESRISHVNDGSWCPSCHNKTEIIFYNKMIIPFQLLEKQVKFDWCKIKKHLPFDFVLESDKIIIELDGIQHFKQVGKWKTPEDTKKHDIYKMQCANKNGYSMIRLLQNDVYFNKYDWITEITIKINKIKEDNVVQNIYICKNNEYKDFDLVI